jgi:small conductance mechanosensitive channel
MEQFLASLQNWFDPHLLGQWLLDWTGRAIAALAIFVIGRWVAGVLTRWLTATMRRVRMDETLARFFGSLTYIVLVAMVVLTAVDALGVPTTNFLAIVGAAGLAVGLALKDSLANFSSGVMLVFFRPFHVGDVIKAAGVEGRVDSIGMFATTLKTPDNITLIVPNSLIYAGTITNYTAESTRRIEIAVTISYDDSVADAKALFKQILDADKRVLAAPPPDILVGDLTANGVGMIIRAWVATSDVIATRGDLLERIKSALGDGGFNTPYPRMRLERHPRAGK